MTVRRLSVAIAAAALFSAAGGAAQAADKGKPIDFTVRSERTTVAPNSGQTIRWDASKGRWGFTLRLQQPDARPSTANDVQAGAFFRITPALQVGGSVAFGEQQPMPRANAAPPADQPKVQLETRFKL